MSENNSFDEFCIVELFGHQRIAGRVSEQAIGGNSFVRVDVPAVNNQPAFTRFFGNGAIYSMTPVSKQIADAAAESYRSVPITPYELKSLARESTVDNEPDQFDDLDDMGF